MKTLAPFVILFLVSCPSGAEIVSGQGADVVGLPFPAFGPQNDRFAFLWSENDLHRGWFYGSAYHDGGADVALETSIRSVSQISDASRYLLWAVRRRTAMQCDSNRNAQLAA